MNEKITLRESLVCRILLLVARILAKPCDEEIRKEIKEMDTKLYISSI